MPLLYCKVSKKKTIIKQHYSIFDGKHISISKMRSLGERDKEDYYNFMGEMGKFKQKKIIQWRKQFIEDNTKRNYALDIPDPDQQLLKFHDFLYHVLII